MIHSSNTLKSLAAFVAGLLVLACTPTVIPELSLSDLAANFEATDALEKRIIVISNVDWTVSCPDAWVTVFPAAGTGNDSFKITVAANDKFEARSSTVTVKAGDKTASVRVSQLSLTPSILVSPTTLEAEAAGGTVSVDVTANSPWTVTVPEDCGWIVADPTSGEGNAKVTLTVAASDVRVARSAAVKFKETIGNTEMSVTVNQAAVPLGRRADSLALVAIYNASKGAEWAKNQWELDKPMDTWSAVTVTEGRVTALKLTTSNVITQEWTLPEDVADLTELTDLRINSNKLTGDIPEAVYGLTKLEKLYFQNDNLTGSISGKIAQLTELTELYVDRNANLAGSGSGQFGTDVIKTIYDPSPVGFMVPPQEAYDGFTTSNCAGVNLSAGNTSAAIVYNSSPLSFPLTGYLYAIDGSYNYVGRVGHYWSAVPDGSLQAYPLTVRYSSGIVSTTGPLGRSYAVSVRPVLEEVSQSGVAEEGCFAVSILQDKFSTAGGTSSIEICSSAFTVDNGYYSSCAPGLAWHVAGFSTNRTTWSTTAPSWFSISRMSARPSGDEDIQFTFSVASAPSETNRFVMVKIVQDCTDQTVILYISQGATAGASSWETNLLFGADNSVCGSGNTVLGSGNFIMGYDNRSEGTGNISIGYENTSIGNNNNSIGTGNYNRGTGNVCCGTYNTCWGSYNRCGGSWQSAYEQIVIGDSNWISWFGN